MEDQNGTDKIWVGYIVNAFQEQGMTLSYVELNEIKPGKSLLKWEGIMK